MIYKESPSGFLQKRAIISHYKRLPPKAACAGVNSQLLFCWSRANCGQGRTASSFLWKGLCHFKNTKWEVIYTVQTSTCAHCCAHLSLAQLRGRCPHPPRFVPQVERLQHAPLLPDSRGWTPKQSDLILSAGPARYLEGAEKVRVDRKELNAYRTTPALEKARTYFR